MNDYELRYYYNCNCPKSFLYLVTSLTFMSLDKKNKKQILCVKHILIVDRPKIDNVSLITIQRVPQKPTGHPLHSSQTLLITRALNLNDNIHGAPNKSQC